MFLTVESIKGKSMNIVKKTKLIKAFIELGQITQKNYKKNEELVKDALWFFETYIKDARPVIEEIREILKG